MIPRWCVLVVGLVSCGLSCSGGGTEPVKVDPVVTSKAGNKASKAKRGSSALDTVLLRRHTRVLSDDKMEGRRPGTPGGTRAVSYIRKQMEALGLRPAGEQGSWVQAVPMRAVSLEPAATSFRLEGGTGEGQALAPGEQIVAGRMGAAGSTTLKAPLVFVGYGVTAPEHAWDDYGEVDLAGKVAVVFVGDPPVEDGRFAGPAMTYYGRWTYKFERALRAGAAGCLVIHETAPASYGWNVVRSSWSGERFALVEPGGEPSAALELQGWLHRDAAAGLAARTDKTLEAWRAMALAPGFTPVELGVTLVASITTRERRLQDYNVLGKIPGHKWPDQAVVITAHWDHLGVDPEAGPDEDGIYNGAVDNASGIAGMLGVAAGLQDAARRGQAPGRSVIFLATTAEEQGLLGSDHYAAHPLVPLEKIVAVANLDSMNVHGRTYTIEVPGLGQSTLEDVLAEVAEGQRRRVVGDERPEAGSYFRSDHFSFAKRGVPAITFRGGKDLVEGGTEAGEALERTQAERYHTVHDELEHNWTFEGALEDAEALLELVLKVASAEQPPRWKPGSEFARLRP